MLYYRDEQAGISIYNGDCREILPCLAEMADLVLTDPPYGVTANEWDIAPEWAWLWPTLRERTKESAAMLLFGQDAFTAEMIVSNRRDYRYSLVWESDRVSGFLNAHHRPLRSHQDIGVFFRSQPPYSPITWQGEPQHSRNRPSRKQSQNYGIYDVLADGGGQTAKQPRTVLYFPKPHPCVHPNEKPVALMEYIIRTYTEPGDLVLDLYAGSGPVAAAALRCGRRCIAIEGREDYCATGVSRLQQMVLPLGAA